MPVLPLIEAAAQLGVTPEALRKRIQRGTVAGRKRGGQWFVVLTSAPEKEPPSGQSGRLEEMEGQTAGQSAGNQEPDTAGHVEVDTAGQPSTLQALARAHEMAAYTATLLEPWQRRVEELATENGRLQERVQHLEQRLVEFEAVTDEFERKQAAPPPGRRWWKFW